MRKSILLFSSHSMKMKTIYKRSYYWYNKSSHHKYLSEHVWENTKPLEKNLRYFHLITLQNPCSFIMCCFNGCLYANGFWQTSQWDSAWAPCVTTGLPHLSRFKIPWHFPDNSLTYCYFPWQFILFFQVKNKNYPQKQFKGPIFVLNIFATKELM